MQNTSNPTMDFMIVPPGILALDCMYFFATTHNDNYTKVELEHLRLGHTGYENENVKKWMPWVGWMSVAVFCVEQFNQLNHSLCALSLLFSLSLQCDLAFRYLFVCLLWCCHCATIVKITAQMNIRLKEHVALDRCMLHDHFGSASCFFTAQMNIRFDRSSWSLKSVCYRIGTVRKML